MDQSELHQSSTTNGLPIAPSMGAALASIHVPQQESSFTNRSLLLTAACMLLAVIAVFIAQGLQYLIALCTNIAFYGQFSFIAHSPAENTLGLGVLVVPVIGGLVVGVMARYGSSAIRGHGIPEAMEQVLTNQSRIHPWLTFLKPLSSAIAIGTGGPFGAEGPIIATGGALGSVFGQISTVTPNERKILLTAGAAAGMTAIFGTPIAAILLSIELLLFEFRARSIIPVALAAVTAAGGKIIFDGVGAVWAMQPIAEPSSWALVLYIVLGALVGLASVFVSKSVYFIEDAFERLHKIHWMWWPAIGAIAVGICGYFVPRTLGVGYNNITDILSHNLSTKVIFVLCLVKFISWAISLGSGTSGGTMAPLFTIGSGLGAVLAALIMAILPSAGLDPRMAALVGMAAMFTGATRALLTSVVMVFETTMQPTGLLPLIGGCSAAYLVSSLLMKNTLMTEKIVRRGVKVPSEYKADFLDQILVRDLHLQLPITISASATLGEIRRWIDSSAEGSSHQGYPVMDGDLILGVITRRDIASQEYSDTAILRDLIHRTPVCIYDDRTLREAADHMVNHDVGRLPVLDGQHPPRLIGIITRSDLLAAHKRRLAENYEDHARIKFKDLWSRKKEET